MSKIKRLIALFLIVLMCPFTFFCAHAENQDNQYTIQTVDMLISDSGIRMHSFSRKTEKSI